MSSVVYNGEFRDTAVGVVGRARRVLAVVAESAHAGENRRECAERDSVARREISVGAFDSRGSRRDPGRAVAVGVKALELAESAADATILVNMFAEAVSGRMEHGYVFGELLVVARVVNAVSKLFVAARDELYFENTTFLKSSRWTTRQ